MTDDPKSTWYAPAAGSAAFVEAEHSSGGGGGTSFKGILSDPTAMFPATAGDQWYEAGGGLILFIQDVATIGDLVKGTNYVILVDTTDIGSAMDGTFNIYLTDSGAGDGNKLGVLDANGKAILKVNVTNDAESGVGAAQGVVIDSPNGTHYRITVADDGTISAVADSNWS